MGKSIDYIIVGSSFCDYQTWQLELLHWSIKKSGQPGKLVVLLSEDRSKKETTHLNLPSDVDIVNLPDWAEEWDNKTNDSLSWGGIPNKYESVSWLCDKNYFNNSDVLLFLDPDMIFVNKTNVIPKKNTIIAQRWVGFNPDQHVDDFYNKRGCKVDPNHNDAIMYPFIIRFDTLKKISKSYKNFCIEFRNEFKLWESEMFGLDCAVKANHIKLRIIDNLGRCVAWDEDESEDLSKIIHFPSVVYSKENERLFFKQDYTTDRDQNIDIHKARNKMDESLLVNVAQQRTDYIYYNKWNFDHIFKDYDGSKGFLVFEPWCGGLNNIRHSLELAICLSYLTNRKLVLPKKRAMNPLEGELDYSDFFDTADLGVESISLYDFCSNKNIEPTYESIKPISRVLEYKESFVVDFEKAPPPKSFVKNREWLKDSSLFDDSEVIFLNKNLLGCFYQTIYTSFDKELKMIVAKHVKYKKEILDIAWKLINILGDKNYYSIHIRRDDFQYKDLRITCKKILDNVKNIIPYGSVLYVSTDHKDKRFFKALRDKYDLVFYSDISKNIGSDFSPNWIPAIEQLICTRGVKFVGMKLSTFSSYIFRMRGYMDDIKDKNYYLNTEVFDEDNQVDFSEDNNFVTNWAREYKDSWNFKKETIFVSVASYCDTQIFETIKSLHEEAWDPSRIVVGIHLQDEYDSYKKLSLLSSKITDLEIKIEHTLPGNTMGVVWARNVIKRKLFSNEDFFLQIDSHSRFKKNWDNILISQYKSLQNTNSIITTYPNHFDVPDDDKEYLKTKYNAPLEIQKFLSTEYSADNRCRAGNLSSLKDYDIKKTRWCSAGFMFTTNKWVREIDLPDDMVFNGEEDYLTFQSYLKGWDLYLTSEATVWHNYNFKNKITSEPYRKFASFSSLEDNSAIRLNELLFDCKHKRTLEECEKYFNVKFRTVKGGVSSETTTDVKKEKVKIEILKNPHKKSKEEIIRGFIKVKKSTKRKNKKNNVKKNKKNIQLKKRSDA